MLTPEAENKQQPFEQIIETLQKSMGDGELFNESVWLALEAIEDHTKLLAKGQELSPEGAEIAYEHVLELFRQSLPDNLTFPFATEASTELQRTNEQGEAIYSPSLDLAFRTVFDAALNPKKDNFEEDIGKLLTDTGARPVEPEIENPEALDLDLGSWRCNLIYEGFEEEVEKNRQKIASMDSKDSRYGKALDNVLKQMEVSDAADAYGLVEKESNLMVQDLMEAALFARQKSIMFRSAVNTFQESGIPKALSSLGYGLFSDEEEEIIKFAFVFYESDE